MFGSKNNQFTVRSIKTGRIKNLPKKELLSGKSKKVLKYAGLSVFTVLLMFIIYTHQQTGEWFKASVLDAPQPFNGTTLPVSMVPDWTHWSGDNHTTQYSQVPTSELVSLPNYDLNKMQFPNESLVWGNSDHDLIRNTKITYSVVYLGNYQLDYQENSGSHLAVDLKMPVGTPIHSIANGKVVKTSMQSTGFGHHIVVQHTNVPDPVNGGTTTLYSCFNHMDDIHVVEGQNVLKGEIIGTSGNTGTSTTPHLHFQIDRESAPWHPYWPFSWSESQAAGLSFFEAVNAGLGMNNAKQNTINPMSYVTQYLGANSLASNTIGGVDNNTDNSANDTDNQDQEESTSEENTQENNESTSESIDEDPVVEVIENPVVDNKIDTSLFTFKLQGESTSLINNGLTITAIDESNQISQLSDSDEVRVEISGVGTAIKKVFKKSDFNNNTIKISVKSSEAGVSNVTIGKSSHQISFVETVAGVSSFRIEHDEHFAKNIVETVKVVALDENGNKTAAVSFGGTLSVVAKDGEARIIPDRLAVNDFVNGEATVRVTVSNSDRLVLRVQNGALIGESTPLTLEEAQTFGDVTMAHPNYTAIKYLYDNGIINGYSDGTFQPNKTVNRVEALKMLMLAFNIQAGPNGELSFTDSDNGAWYASTLATAVSKGIVAGYSDGSFKPANTVNKAEYLKMIFKTNNIELTDSVSANPYADVPSDAWYAPYAYLTNKKNLLDVSNNRLEAANGMTRGDVAETIYRMKYLLDNNLVTYSK